MKRHREDDDSANEYEDDVSSSKVSRKEENDILQDLEKNLNLPDNDALSQQLLQTQKQYFTMYMEKLMHAIPMGKAVIETIQKNGHAGDFMYMYTACKTIIQSLMNIKQSKAMKSVVDMMAGMACRYVHERVITPIFMPIVSNNHLKRAFQAYQSSIKVEENDAELEMKCLLHCINEVVNKETDHCIQLVHPFKSQFTQHMKAVSDYVVALLVSVTEPVKAPERKADDVKILHAAEAMTQVQESNQEEDRIPSFKEN